LAWCFPDESSGHAVSILHRFSDETAIVPSIWLLEVANALVVGMRRGRINEEQLSLVAQLLKELPIEIEAALVVRTFDGVLRMAVTYALSVYDAYYLELAQRLKLPIATTDTKLATAANLCAIELI
jgi:predicted nucleic acid-binding protein